MKYRGKAHEKIFTSFLRGNQQATKTQKAVVYLLSADNQLWMRSKEAIKQNEVDFEKINLSGISIAGYTLCKVAQDMQSNTTHMNLYDLSDKQLVRIKIYRVIDEARKIRRYDIKP